ncbi:AAA family ATPase [Geotalea sp. SG265]|uniref:AAA family ATPase n=1 Tax=Geotalea sp. SG265 TaxID=2922867 RepID=UPI001FAF437D|nr:AAA family ATPase [Geotalea sp. SG265]
MCRKIFVAATGQNTGKTTISLSLVHLARQRYKRVGFIKAIGPKCQQFNDIVVDKDAALMARVFGMEEDIHLMSPVVLGRGSTKRFLDGQLTTAELEGKLRHAFHEMERKYDFLVIEGAGHGGVGSVVGLSNGRVASLCGAPVIMVSGGGIGNVIDSVLLNLPLYQAEGCPVRALMVNKLLQDKREASLGYLQKAFSPLPLPVMAGFDYSPILANPTLNHIARLLDHPLNGDPSARSRIVHHVQLGAASSQKVIDLLEESTLLITTSSRDELIVTISSLYHIPAYREKIAGLVIPGQAPVSNVTQKILDASGIPYIRIFQSTADVFSTITGHISKISVEDEEKIQLICSSAERTIDFEGIERIALEEATPSQGLGREALDYFHNDHGHVIFQGRCPRKGSNLVEDTANDLLRWSGTDC